MKNFMLYLFASIALVCCAQSNKSEQVKSYYPNGKLQTITEMKDGKKNGREELYFDNGNLFMVQYFKDDMLIDSCYMYSKDTSNKLLFRGYSILKSHLTTYHLNGQIFGENDFKEKMEGEGFVKIYFENDLPQSITEYKKNIKNGINILYYSSGNVKRIEHYRKGQKIPPIIDFDSLGKIINYIPAEM